MYVWVCEWEGIPCVYADRRAMEEVFANVDDSMIIETGNTVEVPGYFKATYLEVWEEEPAEALFPRPFARVRMPSDQ